MDAIDTQLSAISASDGPALAYCASGTRSAILWAFARAKSGASSPEDIADALAKAGYAMPGIEAQLAAIAAQS